MADADAEVDRLLDQMPESRRPSATRSRPSTAAGRKPPQLALRVCTPPAVKMKATYGQRDPDQMLDVAEYLLGRGCCTAWASGSASRAATAPSCCARRGRRRRRPAGAAARGRAVALGPRPTVRHVGRLHPEAARAAAVVAVWMAEQ